MVLKAAFRFLDRYTTKHHLVADNIVARIRGRHVFFPYGYFPEGFGDLAIIDTYAREIEAARQDPLKKPAVTPIKPELSPEKYDEKAGIIMQDGIFDTTLPNADVVLPAECHKARFRIIKPQGWDAEGSPKAAAVLLPGLGEHRYTRSEKIGILLAQRGALAVLLEGPYFGTRKPPGQVKTRLREVSDLVKLGRATIEETRSLARWLQEDLGVRHLSIAGWSMGGLHACMASGLMPTPVATAAFMPPPSAHHAFCVGPLSKSVDKSALALQARQTFQIDDVFKALERSLGLTDIRNFPAPRCPDAAIITIGSADGYFPREESMPQWDELSRQWQCDLRTVPIGHVTSYLLESEHFVEQVLESLERVKAHVQPDDKNGEWNQTKLQ